jgi:hypothetical protein
MPTSEVQRTSVLAIVDDRHLQRTQVGVAHKGMMLAERLMEIHQLTQMLRKGRGGRVLLPESYFCLHKAGKLG